MKVIYSLNKIKKFQRPIVSLGVFDGVHLGHRHILRQAVKQAKAIKGTSIVITFTPHPQKAGHLYSLEHRLRLIKELGIDVCIVVNFNKQFAGVLAEDFIKNILVRRIGVAYLYVGRNFRFGKNAQGNFKTFQKFSRIYNFKVRFFKIIKRNNQAVSSTLIRNLIIGGKLKRAQTLLGCPVTILGTVIKGAFIARKLGFPTANINPHHEILPPNGIYIVEAFLRQQKFKGICYIGTKPTLVSQKSKVPATKIGGSANIYGGKSQKSRHVEVHIFDFKAHIYKQYLELYFIKKLRGQKKFKDIQDLAKQIKKDVLIAKAYFSRHHHTAKYSP